MNMSEDILAIKISTANQCLAEIQEAYGRQNKVSARIKFPRGFIRPASNLRRSLPNLGNEIQRRNASYALITLDVLSWIAIRTDLDGAALSMVVKEAISNIGELCEWMTKEATRGTGSRRSYVIRTQRLVDEMMISDELKQELDWIWEIRCNEHLHEVTELEHTLYARADYNRARSAYAQLKKSLIDAYGYSP